MKRALLALGYLWSAPWGACGLLLAALFWACGWYAHRPEAHSDRVPFVIYVDARGPLSRWLRRRDWRAFTLGWTVFSWEGEIDDNVWLHEQRHVRQGLVLGPLFPAVYLALLLVFGYERHPLERDARRAAGEE